MVSDKRSSLHDLKVASNQMRPEHATPAVAQRLGRRTSDLAVMGLIRGPRVIRHLGQLSLPSLQDR